MPLHSITHAFWAQGVSLKYPVRSRSGIRSDNGAVVIAMDQVDVQASADGFRCRLWAPGARFAACADDWPSMKERLEHCRLAARQGGADGLLITPGATIEPGVILTLCVERRGLEYWASWGNTARSEQAVSYGPVKAHRACVALAA